MKTKTKALGFNRKELEGLALKIDKNLELEEDASDEDVDAAIETAVEAALPFLEVSHHFNVCVGKLTKTMKKKMKNQTATVRAMAMKRITIVSAERVRKVVIPTAILKIVNS